MLGSEWIFPTFERFLALWRAVSDLPEEGPGRCGKIISIFIRPYWSWFGLGNFGVEEGWKILEIQGFYEDAHIVSGLKELRERSDMFSFVRVLGSFELKR